MKDLTYYFELIKSTKEWEGFEEKYSFIKECYELAKKVPLDEFYKKYINVASITELKKVRDNVAIAIAELDSSALSRVTMRTPITDQKEQLNELYQKIIGDIQDYEIYKK